MPLTRRSVRRATAWASSGRSFWMVACRMARAAVVTAEHRLLLDAVRRRDPVDAERFLAGHIRRTPVELTRHPELFRT